MTERLIVLVVTTDTPRWLEIAEAIGDSHIKIQAPSALGALATIIVQGRQAVALVIVDDSLGQVGLDLIASLNHDRIGPVLGVSDHEAARADMMRHRCTEALPHGQVAGAIAGYLGTTAPTP